MPYIPLGGQTPLEPPPTIPLDDMLTEQRAITFWFIETDPTDIVLIPQVRTKQPSGGHKLAQLPPRPSQRVKMIYPAGQSDGAVVTLDGQERRYDFIIVANWNATVKKDDFWEDSQNQFWIVTGVSPYNGYEVKALVNSYGEAPQNG